MGPGVQKIEYLR